MLTYTVTNPAYDPNPVGSYTTAELLHLARHHKVAPFTFRLDGTVVDGRGLVVAVENRASPLEELRSAFPRLDFTQIGEEEHYEVAAGVLVISVWQPLPGHGQPWDCAVIRDGAPTRGPTAAQAVCNAIRLATLDAHNVTQSCLLATRDL